MQGHQRGRQTPAGVLPPKGTGSSCWRVLLMPAWRLPALLLAVGPETDVKPIWCNANELLSAASIPAAAALCHSKWPPPQPPLSLATAWEGAPPWCPASCCHAPPPARSFHAKQSSPLQPETGKPWCPQTWLRFQLPEGLGLFAPCTCPGPAPALPGAPGEATAAAPRSWEGSGTSLKAARGRRGAGRKGRAGSQWDREEGEEE